MITNSRLYTTEERACPIRSLTIPGAMILDACKVEASYGQLLVLKADGEICGVNLHNGTITSLCTVELPRLPSDDDNHFGKPALRLYANTSGTFCAIVADKGREGLVVATSSGTITKRLDGGDYYQETVPFSASFVRVDDMDVFIYRTEWNRLDAMDPATGRSLTERSFEPYEETGKRPPHYLDYFHGQLWSSPDGSRILDDGWVWHPASIPRIWSITDWVRFNPWESEDGASVVELPVRDDWNTPACWMSERRVAMWGLGEWDVDEVEERGKRPGVRIFDATSTDRSSDGQWAIDMDETPHQLFSDGQHLFIVGQTCTTIWDTASRSNISTLPNFSARLHDAKRGTLIAIEGHTVSELALPWLASGDVDSERVEV